MPEVELLSKGRIAIRPLTIHQMHLVDAIAKEDPEERKRAFIEIAEYGINGALSREEIESMPIGDVLAIVFSVLNISGLQRERIEQIVSFRPQ